MQCPRCQHIQSDIVVCERCGIYFDKWHARQELRGLPRERPKFPATVFLLGALAAIVVLYLLQAGQEPPLMTPIVIKEPMAGDTAVTYGNTPPSRSTSPATTRSKPYNSGGDYYERRRAWQKKLSDLDNERRRLYNELNYSSGGYRSGRDSAQQHEELEERRQKQREIQQKLEIVNAEIQYVRERQPRPE